MITPLAAHAEEAENVEADAAPATDIIVTGTRGEKRVLESLSPVDVVNSDALVQTGRPNLRDALQNLVPSFTNSAGYPGQLGFATKTATLRGLGANETLVLVNGKRRHTMGSIFFGGGSAGQSPTDVDLIPTSAISHVEILRDGAAAQYGSDAIAGVINIILKSNAGGGFADLTYGQYARTTGELGRYGRSFTGLVNQGFRIGEDGYLSLSFDFQRSDYTNNTGYVPLTTPIYATIGGQPDPRENGKSRYRQISGLPKIDKEVVAYNLKLPLSDSVSLYSFSTYAHRRSQAFGWFRTAASQQNIPELNPDGYLPQFITTDNDFQGVAGLEGDFGSWHWDASSSYSVQHSKIYNHNTLNPSYGPASPRNFYNGALITHQWTNNLDLRKTYDEGPLGGELTVAGGFEYRRDGYEQRAGDEKSWSNGGYVFTSGPLAGRRPNPGASGLGGFSPADASKTWRSNVAVYLDLDQKVTRNWEVALAGRYEHYSDFGSAFSGKLSTRLEFAPGYALRATVNNGFHAPTLPQQFYTAKTTSYNPHPDTGILGLNTTNYARVTDPMAVALGSRALKPEKSLNFSVGLVAQPTPDLQITLDLYQIDLKDRVLPISFQGSRVQAILQDAGLLPPDLGVFYNVTYEANIAKTRTRGADLTINYRSDLGDLGTIRWTLLGNLSSHRILNVYALPPALAATGISLLPRGSAGLITDAYPRSTIKATAAWSIGDFDLTLRGTHYSSTRKLDNTSAARDELVKPAFLLDLEASWRITDFAKLAIGGQNLLNKRPEQLNAEAQRFFSIPQVDPNYSSAAIYSADGTYLFAKLRLDW